jgi:glycosyltransferase involved in cell wall biosynthesis
MSPKVRLVPRHPTRISTVDRRRLLVLKRCLAAKGVDIDLYQPGEAFDILVTTTEDFGAWLPLAREARRRGAVVVHDSTDLLVEAPTSRTHLEGLSPLRRRVRRFKAAVKNWIGHPRSARVRDAFWDLCNGFVVGSKVQAEAMRRRYPDRPAIDLVDPVDFSEYRCVAEPRDVPTPCVVWEGMAHNVLYLQECAPALRKLLERRRIRLRVVADRWRLWRWEGLLDNVDVLRHLGLQEAEFREWTLDRFTEELTGGDLAVAPLYLDDPFCLGKPANKILGYASMQLPVVASAVPAYREVIEQGRFGFLASTPAEWESNIARLADEPDLRKELGARGREYVRENFGVEKFSDRYIDFLRQLCGG